MCYHPDENYFRELARRQAMEDRRRIAERAEHAKRVSGNAGMVFVESAVQEAVVEPTPAMIDA